MKIENKLALIPERESKKYISNIAIEYVKSKTVNEKNVDSLVQDILVSKLGYERETEAELAVTALRNSSIKISSKTVKASGSGELDCTVFINDKLQIIIECPRRFIRTPIRFLFGQFASSQSLEFNYITSVREPTLLC